MAISNSDLAKYRVKWLKMWNVSAFYSRQCLRMGDASLRNTSRPEDKALPYFHAAYTNMHVRVYACVTTISDDHLHGHLYGMA